MTTLLMVLPRLSWHKGWRPSSATSWIRFASAALVPQPGAPALRQPSFRHRHRHHHRHKTILVHKGSTAVAAPLVRTYSSAAAAATMEAVNAEDPTTTTLSPSPSAPPLFRIKAPYEPTGDQPEAIAQILQALQNDQAQHCVLRGSTGTGKTFAMAQIIAQLQKRPALVLCHNKTLAIQLARELGAFFPNNAVELFVSYYKNFRPESYNEQKGKYLAKQSSIDPAIDALRHRATRALVSRKDVVVVASVSCIFGVGMPEEYLDASSELTVGQIVDSTWAAHLEANLLYQFNNLDDKTFARGQYQMEELGNGDTRVTLWLPHDSFPMRILLRPGVANLPDKGATATEDSSVASPPSPEPPLRVISIGEGTKDGFRPVHSARIFPVRIALCVSRISPLVVCSIASLQQVLFSRLHSLSHQSDLCFCAPIPSSFQAKHHVIPESRLGEACNSIRHELQERLKELRSQGNLEAAERLDKRVTHDLNLLSDTGYCPGVENYSRHLAGRAPGTPPSTLLDYIGLFNEQWLLIVDESHVTVPQLGAMYTADRNRKRCLIKHGYRLPSALDNRPLQWNEFWDKVQQTLFVSATPGKHELQLLEEEGRAPVDMIIRPTYVCDPVIEVRPTAGQLDDLLREVRLRADQNERTLVVTLSRKDAEDLASYLADRGVKTAYIHCKLKTKERADALKALQVGDVDCLVGVNLLREGLDLPQVSLVAVLNADSEGFLRCATSLVQTVGRAARNVKGTAIFYANRVTDSMKRCMDDTARRRKLQLEYNAKFGLQMKSTMGSSTASIFDILQDKIELEQGANSYMITPHSVVKSEHSPLEDSQQFLFCPAIAVTKEAIETGHIPASPGVYFWKDEQGDYLYIGKAVNLRTRVKSYLSPSAAHNQRIKVMVTKAASVEFVLTPSDRDALILESKLIKLHQPPFNVLLKDDEHYPYICASVGDEYPSLSIASHRADDSSHRYFGPYTSFKELKRVLQSIEDRYGLRGMSFEARHGSATKEQYQQLFLKALKEVFDGHHSDDLVQQRMEYESAGDLFDSAFNDCRDVVAVSEMEGTPDELVVLVLQLRDGLVAGQFSYTCRIPFGSFSTTDYAAAIQTVLEQRHYPSCHEASGSRFPWFPDEVLLSHAPSEIQGMAVNIHAHRQKMEGSEAKAVKISAGARKGKKVAADQRALEFALSNAKQVAHQKSLAQQLAEPTQTTDIDPLGASTDIAELLDLPRPPSRIECYDISHTQGAFPVGSRVVFIDGKPVPDLYRRFNIQSVVGIDDYASLEEVTERRFRHARVNGVHGPEDKLDAWALPDLVVIDGGPGQLGAAIKGMSKAGVYPLKDLLLTPVASGKNRRASVAVCALAKRNEELYVLGESDPVNKVKDSPGMLLLRALRDESHRFALRSHRSRRSILKS